MSTDAPHNPLNTLLGYRLRRVSNTLMADLARDLRELGLKPGEASVLLLVRANSGITQSEIGRMLDIQRANMTPLTAQLDSRGLIGRERVDGRSHGLAVTPEGEKLCRAVRIAMERHDARFQALLSGKARSGLLAALEALETSGLGQNGQE
jgi:DNA-binding MarR family transcriptional regulator